MNRLLRPIDLDAPLPLLAETVLLGMPHLTMNGLSETWLLKELGHRHWLMLARLAGRQVPDFRDTDGAPVYAAFNALSIADADFAAAGENDELTIVSSIERLSRTQVLSRHLLSIDGRAIGTVTMISVFVRRAESGRNHVVARVALESLPPVVPADRRAADFAELMAEWRAGRLADHLGLELDASAELARHLVDPCPAQDFNGAGFLYFASFVAFVDRAEWAFDRGLARGATTLRRDVVFRGNLDPGEQAAVTLHALARGAASFAHHCRLRRLGDGMPIADVVTLRARR